MDYLQILQRTLSAIGGGNGDPHNEYVRHFLPLVMWGILFTTIWSANSRRPANRLRWLMSACACAALFELTQLIGKAVVEVGSSSSGDGHGLMLLERLNGPVSMGWMALTFLLLTLAMVRFIGGSVERKREIQRTLPAAIAIVAVCAVVTWQWIKQPKSVQAIAFDTSMGHTVLTAVCLFIVLYALMRLLQLRNASIASRVAWVPFALFALSQVLILVATFSSEPARQWLWPVANNLIIWATPWVAYVFWRDLIEEQQQLALQLHQTERLDVVGRLAAGVAHDFNNHLQGILGFAEVGHLDAENDARHQAHYSSIMESVERARTLVKKLMAFKRDSQNDEVTDISLPQMIYDLGPMLGGLIGPNIKTYNHLDPKANMVRADRSMLEQAIVNVVVNARDAMPDGGTLTVRSRLLDVDESEYDESMIRLTIADTGKGMTEDEKKKVFQPFYTTKASTGGSGIGLASSLVAIRGMGGEMAIESEKGRGTVLIIDMPTADRPDKLRPKSVIDPNDFGQLSGTERVLVAEDEPSLRHVASSFLTRSGYDVVLARDGEHVLELLSLSDEPFDLLLLDVVMPRKDGYTAYAELRKNHPNIPVVFMTANFAPANEQVAQEPHLSKPFKQMAMLKIVRSTLDKNSK